MMDEIPEAARLALEAAMAGGTGVVRINADGSQTFVPSQSFYRKPDPAHALIADMLEALVATKVSWEMAHNRPYGDIRVHDAIARAETFLREAGVVKWPSHMIVTPEQIDELLSGPSHPRDSLAKATAQARASSFVKNRK
jgi:hypothetical protein